MWKAPSVAVQIVCVHNVLDVQYVCRMRQDEQHYVKKSAENPSSREMTESVLAGVPV